MAIADVYIPIRLIQPHEIGVNLLIPRTLVCGPRLCGKTSGIKYAISQLEGDLYTVFVHNRQIKDYKYENIKNVHVADKFKSLDIDSIATKIFVDDIDLCEKYIPLNFSRIYAATTGKIDFREITKLIQAKEFPFERICIVDSKILF